MINLWLQKCAIEDSHLIGNKLISTFFSFLSFGGLRGKVSTVHGRSQNEEKILVKHTKNKHNLLLQVMWFRLQLKIRI